MNTFSKADFIDLKKSIVAEILGTFYIHYSGKGEDGDEETVKLLNEIVEGRMQEVIKLAKP